MTSEPTRAPRLRIAGTVLSTRDAQALAAFYERLLGWPRLADEPGWVVLRTDPLAQGLSFHEDAEHVRVMLDPDGHPFCLFAAP